MKLRLILLFIIGLFATNVSSQTFIGVQGGPKIDMFTGADTSGFLRPSSATRNIWGFNLGYLYERNIIVETGIYRNSFATGFYIVDDENRNFFKDKSVKTFTSWQIPLRVSARIVIKEDKFHLIPFIGMTVILNKKSGHIATGSGEESVFVDQGAGYTESASYYADVFKYSGRKKLVEVGFSAEYSIAKDLYITVHGYYSSGLDSITTTNFTYSLPGVVSEKGAINFKGNGLHLLFGLKYQVGSLMMMRDEEE